jgi:hypothetical protein
MGAFDLVQKTVRHKSWDKGEEVTIREMTFGQSTQLTAIAMADVAMGDVDDKEKVKSLKMGELDMGKAPQTTLEMCIVSWTFKKNGKPVPVTPANIKAIRGHYGDFILEEIEKFNPEPDAEFQDDSGEQAPTGQGGVPAGDDTSNNPE